MITFFQETYQVNVWNAPEQHAIVFNIPPETLAALIDDPVLGPEVLREIKDAALGTAQERVMYGGPVLTRHAIDTWKQNYLEQYPAVDYELPVWLVDTPLMMISRNAYHTRLQLKDADNAEEVRRVLDCKDSSPTEIDDLTLNIHEITDLHKDCMIIYHARQFGYLEDPLTTWPEEINDEEGKYDYLQRLVQRIVDSRQPKPVDSNTWLGLSLEDHDQICKQYSQYIKREDQKELDTEDRPEFQDYLNKFIPRRLYPFRYVGGVQLALDFEDWFQKHADQRQKQTDEAQSVPRPDAVEKSCKACSGFWSWFS
jgi:hypothetical protein